MVIGREVLFLHTDEKTPRNGEGTFLRLNDGRIMFAYTKFSGTLWYDDASADIAVVLSSDEGETWSEPETIIYHDSTSKNVMCPSLIRMNNGDTGLIFLKKILGSENAVPWFTRSEDEGKTWSEPERIINDTENYYVIENDHAIVLKDGRILLPANFHSEVIDGKTVDCEHGLKVIFCSDDDGKSWYELSERQDIPFSHKSRTGLQETMLYEFSDGKLWALSRTDMAFQYECFSYDRGKTWTLPEPNTFFSSPPSPLLIKRAMEKTVAVFNPVPNFTGRDTKSTWGRTPLLCAVSDNDGESFHKIFYLEKDPLNAYCYPAIFDGGSYMLIAYYHSDNTGVALKSLKMKKVEKSEII